MITVPLWVVALLLLLPGPVGVLGGLVVHWWCELRALRPAYLAAKACNTRPPRMG